MTDRHPSWGMICASRWTAGGRGRRLFGLNLPGHSTGVTLRIREGTRDVRFGEEYCSAVGGRTICEVTLSPVQWAEMLTSMNVGDGVPCTVDFALGDTARREDPPVVDSEPEEARKEFARRIAGSADRLGAARARLRAKLAGKLSATLAKEVDDEMQMAEQEIRSNAPFYVQQFTEATDRVATAAKAEVDAFLTTVAAKLGVKALRSGEGAKLITGEGE